MKQFLALLTVFGVYKAQSQQSQLRFPCPHIFVHDIGGSASSWDDLAEYFAVLDQEELQFCLNQDASTTELFADVSDELSWGGNPPAADLYFLNFNCGAYGNCDNEIIEPVQSNEAAILKQALAVGKAVDLALAATARQKVVLVGHGAGGLAIREYLTNPALWLAETSRVAKVSTIGTPHMGTNYEPAGGVMAMDDGLSLNSEAMRDIRNSYDSAGVFLQQGAFLWGLTNETQADMYNDFSTPWVNTDVNCDGDTLDIIPFYAPGGGWNGLNARPVPPVVEYSSIHDPANAFTNSGNLQFNNISSQSASWQNGGCNFCTFLQDFEMNHEYCESWAFNGNDAFTQGHTGLLSNGYNILLALDEPDCFNQAYPVEVGPIYAGISTPQGEGSFFGSDYDAFKLTLEEPALITVNILEVNSASPIALRVSLPPSNGGCSYGEILATDLDIVTGSSMSIGMEPGDYFLDFHCGLTAGEFLEQYWFYLTTSPLVPGCQDPLSCTYDDTSNWSDDGMCEYPFEPCDDGNDLTINDTYNSFCVCIGDEVSGIREDSRQSFAMSPNPANAIVTIAPPVEGMQSEILVFDMRGQLMLSEQSQGQHALDVENLPTGLYQVHLIAEGDFSAVQTLSVQH